MRTLEKVFVRTRARNEPWPKELLGGWFSKCFLFRLDGSPAVSIIWFFTKWLFYQPRFWLQSDNTVKECRNTFAARILSSLTQAGVWSTSSQNFLGVGHTHEDVDGVLALCKAALDPAAILHTHGRLQQDPGKAVSGFSCPWTWSRSGACQCGILAVGNFCFGRSLILSGIHCPYYNPFPLQR